MKHRVRWEEYVLGGELFGYDAYLGSLVLKVGTIRRLSKDDRYNSIVGYFPGFPDLGTVHTMEEAKVKFEKNVAKWFELATKERAELH